MATATATPMTLTQKIVAIAVTIIIISTVALPIIDDSEIEEKKITQNVGQRFSMLEPDDSKTYTITYSSGNIIVNGVTYETSVFDTVVYSDAIVVDVHNSNLRVASADYLENTLQVVINGGTITYTNTSNVDRSVTYSWALIVQANGDYGLFKQGTTVYVNESSKIIYARTNTNLSNSDLTPSSITVRNVMSGTFNDMKSDFAVATSEDITSVELSGFITDVTEVSKEVYSITPGTNTLSIIADTNLGEYSNPSLAMSLIAAPLSYYYYGDSNMFGVVAIILMLVPLMMAVRMIALKRN